MWCWSRMGRISSTDRTRNVLYRFKGERNIVHKIKGRKGQCLGHILYRNYLRNHVIEGKIEVRGRRRRRRQQQLYEIKETRGYWALKEESLDRNLLRTDFGRRYGYMWRQTTVLLLLLLLLLYEATANTSAFILESLPSKKVLCLGRYFQHYPQYVYMHLFPRWRYRTSDIPDDSLFFGWKYPLHATHGQIQSAQKLT